MSWIQAIATGIEKAFSSIRPALAPIPPLLLICELVKRPGLSAIALTSAIIQRLPEAGIETGLNPDGSENKTCGLVRVMCEEIIKEIKDNAKVTCVITPGSIIGTGTGASAAGPIVVTTVNTMIGSLNGLIQ